MIVPFKKLYALIWIVIWIHGHLLLSKREDALHIAVWQEEGRYAYLVIMFRVAYYSVCREMSWTQTVRVPVVEDWCKPMHSSLVVSDASGIHCGMQYSARRVSIRSTSSFVVIQNNATESVPYCLIIAIAPIVLSKRTQVVLDYVYDYVYSTLLSLPRAARKGQILLGHDAVVFLCNNSWYSRFFGCHMLTLFKRKDSVSRHPVQFPLFSRAWEWRSANGYPPL